MQEGQRWFLNDTSMPAIVSRHGGRLRKECSTQAYIYNLVNNRVSLYASEND